MRVAANTGRDTVWSRRRALRTAGAALVSAAGIAEHAPDAGAQSPAASQAIAATPTIPADFGEPVGRAPRYLALKKAA